MAFDSLSETGTCAGHRRWFAARTLTSKEAYALQNLERQGFPTFLPRFRRPPSPKAKRSPKLALAAFFPGYIFVSIDIGRERWRAVNSTFGVLHLVQFGDRPAPAPVGFVERLQGLCDEQGLVCFEERLRVGQSAKVVGGCFDGFIGDILRLDASAQRVTLLIEMLGRASAIEVPRAAVVAAER